MARWPKQVFSLNGSPGVRSRRTAKSWLVGKQEVCASSALFRRGALRYHFTHQAVKRTFTSKLSNMLGTQKIRATSSAALSLANV